MSNGQQGSNYDAQGFSAPMRHPENPEVWVVWHEDDDNSHQIRIDEDSGKWIIISRNREKSREGQVQGGGKRELKPKRAIDEEMGLGEEIGGFGQAVAHGFTLGFADELIGLMSPELAEQWEANRKQYRQQHRYLSGLGEIAGGIGSFAAGGGAARLGAGGARLAARTLGGATARGAGRVAAQGTGRIATGAGRVAAGAERLAQAGSAPSTVQLGRGARAARKATQALEAGEGAVGVGRTVQGARGLGGQMWRSGLEGAGFGGGYAAGEAEGGVGDRLRAAKGGALLGAGIGLGVPVGIAGLAKGGGGLARMFGGTTQRFREGVEKGRTLGGDSPLGPAALAREERAARGGLLGGGVVGGAVRSVPRMLRTLLGRSGIALPGERTAGRAFISQLDKAKPSDWRATIAEVREMAGGRFDDILDDDLWLQLLADLMEDAGTLQSGQLMATITPQIAADVASAARKAGAYKDVASGLLPKAASQERIVSREIIDSIEAWTANRAGSLGIEVAEDVTTAGRRLSGRLEARSVEANKLYGDLLREDLPQSALSRLREVFRRERIFDPNARDKTLANELSDMYEDMLSNTNRKRRAAGEKPVGLADDGTMVSLMDALEGKGVSVAGILDSIGQAEQLVRVIKNAARKYQPSKISGTANVARHTRLRGIADDVYDALDDAAGGKVRDTMKSYRKMSSEIEFFEMGADLARTAPEIRDLEDILKLVRGQAVEGFKDQAENALREGYISSLADEARRAGATIAGETPEAVFQRSSAQLEALFGADAVDELLRKLVPQGQRRAGLRKIEGASPTAGAVETGTGGAEVGKGITYGLASQFQALAREFFDALKRSFGIGEAQQLATTRLGQMSAREGLLRLAPMARYDAARAMGRQRLGRQLTAGGGIVAGSQIRPPPPPRPTYEEVTGSLLTAPIPRERR